VWRRWKYSYAIHPVADRSSRAEFPIGRPSDAFKTEEHINVVARAIERLHLLLNFRTPR
jgi:hypothetical protein